MMTMIGTWAIQAWIRLKVDSHRFRHIRSVDAMSCNSDTTTSYVLNPDETIEAVMQPVPDDDSSSEEPHIREPERIEIKQRHVSHDSDEKPPKAKAKVQIKKQKVQLPGYQNPIEVPTVKPPKDEEDDEPHPTAASSNDPTTPLPTSRHIRLPRHSRKMMECITHRRLLMGFEKPGMLQGTSHDCCCCCCCCCCVMLCRGTARARAKTPLQKARYL